MGAAAEIRLWSSLSGDLRNLFGTFPYGGPAVVPAYDPNQDVSLFWRMAGAATDDGAGRASQINDVSTNGYHVTFTSTHRPAIVAADATANNQRTYTCDSATWGTPGGPATPWRRMHNGTSQKFWIVFKPDATATRFQPLFSSAAGLSGGAIGTFIAYDGVRQALEVSVARGSLPQLYYLASASAECAANAWHILVYETSSTGMTAWLDGAKLLDGDWANTPNAGDSNTRYVCGDPSWSGFRGQIAEMGSTSSTTDSVASITAFLRQRYGVAATRAPDRRLNWADGSTYSALAPTVPVVRSYFAKSTSTPNATQVVGVGGDLTFTFTARARSGGEYELDTTTSTRDERQVSWFETASGGIVGPGAVSSGKTRVIYLAMGESGMAGYSASTPLPVGYPPANQSVWALNGEFIWKEVAEPLVAPGTYPVDAIFNPSTAGVGPAGLFAWKRQQALGSGYEVGVLLCALGGQTTALYNNLKSSRNSLAGAAIARLRRALMLPNTVFGGIIWDIGINEASQASPTWATNMAAIMAYIRTAVPATANAPMYYSHLFTTAPTDQSYPSWATVGGDQTSYQDTVGTPKKIMVSSEPIDWNEPAHVHRGPNSNPPFADAYAAAAAAYPYP